MTDAERLDRLTWEQLPLDFRRVPWPRVDWSAWAGYDPWDNPREKPSLRKGVPRHVDRHR